MTPAQEKMIESVRSSGGVVYFGDDRVYIDYGGPGSGNHYFPDRVQVQGSCLEEALDVLDVWKKQRLAMSLATRD